MASIGDVAAQVKAACGKAAESRAALEQAEDLALEVHGALAGALTGATHLESDTTAMLADFLKVADGCKGYLWPLLTEAMKAAESIAARLEGVPDSAPPPEKTPTEPLVIPAERIDQLRRELPPPVVPNSGQKTHGWWIGPDGKARPIVSGRDPRSALVNQQLAEKGAPRRTPRAGDVELKLAAEMVEKGIKDATVVINHTPCKGPLNCDTLVPILLPEGATLTVYGINTNGTRTRTRYTGGAQPWWR